jgi:hypothetical protein
MSFVGPEICWSEGTLDRPEQERLAILATLAAATINHNSNRRDEVAMGLLVEHLWHRNGTIPVGGWLDVSYVLE